MKEAIVKHEDVTYKLKSLGFFKANRLLFKLIGPLTPILTGIDRSSEDSLLSQIVPLIDPDLFEDIVKTLLEGTLKDGEKMDLEELDYELAVELIQEAIKLNYSSLGKLLAKLKSMIPASVLAKIEEKTQEVMKEETKSSSEKCENSELIQK